MPLSLSHQPSDVIIEIDQIEVRQFQVGDEGSDLVNLFISPLGPKTQHTLTSLRLDHTSTELKADDGLAIWLPKIMDIAVPFGPHYVSR